MSPDDVKLSIENNVLTIRGEKKQEAEHRVVTESRKQEAGSRKQDEGTFPLPASRFP